MYVEHSKPPFPQEKKSILEDSMAELAKYQMEMKKVTSGMEKVPSSVCKRSKNFQVQECQGNK